jgi:hypothetical protein
MLALPPPIGERRTIKRDRGRINTRRVVGKQKGHVVPKFAGEDVSGLPRRLSADRGRDLLQELTQLAKFNSHRRDRDHFFRQHALNLRPLPHGQRAFRASFAGNTVGPAITGSCAGMAFPPALMLNSRTRYCLKLQPYGF